jgi:adhesion G protein-coupled receptor L4
MFGIEMTANRIVCGVIAAFLHYFFLAAFAWMFLEGKANGVNHFNDVN